MEYDLITVAETEPFQRKARRLLSEDEKTELITYLSAFSNAGVLVQGTGGIRKLRWAKSGSGKSGGVRVIYYFHNSEMPLYLLTLFGKNEKTNLSKAERNILSRAVRELVKYWSREK
jgi:hypothetical protein